jgi:PKHD-type hydroxylase
LASQAATVKNNLQLPEASPIAQQLRTAVLEALSKNPTFFSAALPKRIYPPLFNRYGGEANSFGNHVDNAIRTHPATAQHVRTDLSFTLFLNDPPTMAAANSSSRTAWAAARSSCQRDT